MTRSSVAAWLDLLSSHAGAGRPHITYSWERLDPCWSGQSRRATDAADSADRSLTCLRQKPEGRRAAARTRTDSTAFSRACSLAFSASRSGPCCSGLGFASSWLEWGPGGEWACGLSSAAQPTLSASQPSSAALRGSWDSATSSMPSSGCIMSPACAGAASAWIGSCGEAPLEGCGAATEAGWRWFRWWVEIHEKGSCQPALICSRGSGLQVCARSMAHVVDSRLVFCCMPTVFRPACAVRSTTQKWTVLFRGTCLHCAWHASKSCIQPTALIVQQQPSLCTPWSPVFLVRRR